MSQQLEQAQIQGDNKEEIESSHQENEGIFNGVCQDSQELKNINPTIIDPQNKNSQQHESDQPSEIASHVSDGSSKISILVNGEVIQDNSTKLHGLPIEKNINLCPGLLNSCADEMKEQVDIQRFSSQQSPILSSERLSVTASPSSEISGSAQMLSYMNKQQSTRDMKNWMHGRSLGGFAVRSSLPENKVSSYDQIETPKTANNNHTENESSFVSDHEESAVNSKFVKYGESFCSPARTIGSSKSKKIIKVRNSISSELRQQDFKDDEQIEVDESAYQAILQHYDISKNISVSIKSLISNGKNTNDPVNKMVTIPVLVSVKTADQTLPFNGFKDGEDEAHLQEDILSRLSRLGVNQISLEEGSSSSGEYHEEDGDISCDGIEGISGLVTKIEEKEHQQRLSDDIQEENESDEEQEEQLIKTIQQKFKSRPDLKKPERQTSVDAVVSKLEEDEQQQQQNQKRIKSPSKNVFFHAINNNNKTKETQDPFLSDEDNHKFKKSLFRAESLHGNISTSAQTASPIPQRFPIDLICVIDTSGSMNGEPLALVKETLLFLVELLQNGDRICLIQFSTNAKRLTPLLSISKQGNRELMREEIERLVAKGGTNINQGMQVAFDVLKQRRFKNAITSVFLLSDGLNDGAEHRIRDLLKMMNFYQNYSEDSFTIQTFGFGKDHDPDLMDKISQLMDGNFYYIADIHRLDECFIDALGGLFSVVSQNVDIRIRIPQATREKVSIAKTFGQIWNTELEAYEYRININQLLSGVSKDYVLELKIDAEILQNLKNQNKPTEDSHQDDTQKQDQEIQNLDISQNILEIELTASSIRLKADKNHKTTLQSNKNDNVSDNSPVNSAKVEILNEQDGQEKNIESDKQTEQQDKLEGKVECLEEAIQHKVEKSVEGSCEMDYSSDGCIQKVVKVAKLDIHTSPLNDKEVQLHYLRVKSAEGLERCQTLAAAKKFDEGSELVQKLLTELKASPPETLAQLSKLVGDLKEAAEALKKKVSEQIGWHRMISCKRMHMEQRSAGTDLAYQNSIQKIMVQKRQTFKNQFLNPIQSGKDLPLHSPIQPFNHPATDTLLIDHNKDNESKLGQTTDSIQTQDYLPPQE